jgi:hypothetical protein
LSSALAETTVRVSADPYFREHMPWRGGSVEPDSGQATAEAFSEAGAAVVLVGIADAWKPFPGMDALRAIGRIETVPLDLTDRKLFRLACARSFAHDMARVLAPRPRARSRARSRPVARSPAQSLAGWVSKSKLLATRSTRRARLGVERAWTRRRSRAACPFAHGGQARGAGSCMEARRMADQEQWVIWNGSAGILDMVTIGRIEDGAGGRSAFLAPPYDIVGPFSLDELETQGRIAFGACLVMSRRRWQEDQVELRREAQEKRRALQMRLELDDSGHREVLSLATEGELEPAQINTAFRRLANTAHPTPAAAMRNTGASRTHATRC